MKLGIALRSMGGQATRETLLACSRSAEELGFDDLWVQDHIAIPPDDAEGSGGRYLDPLASLAFLAAATSRIGLGTGVLVLPYRAALPTAKWIATIQELSGGRLLLGVGVGWMEAEFRVLGIPRSARGRTTDEMLAFLHRCFENDEVEVHGQRFLFRPRPPRPPIYVGGGAPHALERTLRFGDGWMPMGGDPEKLAPAIAELRERAAEQGREAPDVVLLTSFPLRDPGEIAARAERFREIGVSHLVFASRYADADEFRAQAETLAKNARAGDR